MTSRTSSKASLKEDTNHVLEELWDDEEEEPLYKIFTRECLGAKSIQKFLRNSKAELRDLSCRDHDDAVLYLQNCEVGDVCIMVKYQSHLRAKNLLHKDIGSFRFNSMNRKDCISFVNHLDAMASVISTGDIATTPPTSSGLADNFKVTYSPA